ncbi:DUF6249 domain-containing protein [Microbulbifer pacificus]|uniref:DUF6249 domain-containing protein n=1 Tax=Microbulbifer pacificus TaxID=407164 RepID=A0AAU0N3P5_9GAMM|nr:DUF6249 domain-containing protein [Microbulbifer pacificus]WOX06898.1 DUF6249 domain-containing protein [Microbulbifer pacificus]
MNEDTLALLIPLGFFLLIGMSLWMVLNFRAKRNLEVQQTLRLALDKGVELPPKLIEQLGASQRHPQQDMRRGIVWMACALGMALLGFFVPDPSNQAFLAMLGVAAIPFSIGLAYLAMYHFSKPQPA